MKSMATLSIKGLLIGTLIIIVCLGALTIPSCSPREHNVPPIITHPDEIDQDFNGIEDALESKIMASSKEELEEPIAVIVILKQPYTETDLDSFLSLGGEIKHTYERVTYGFSGTIPLGKIEKLATSLSDKLNIIKKDRPVETL